VFVAPFLGGRGGFPTVPGFGDGCHRVIWVRAARYSDVVCALLRERQVAFDGLVCGRAAGDFGVRIRDGGDAAAVVQAVEHGLQARVRPTTMAPRIRLRARGVPAALIPERGLQLVVDAIGSGLTLVEAQVLDISAYSASVDLVVSGPLSGDQWILRNLGLRPVTVKRLPPRSGGQRLPLAPVARAPVPHRVLSGEERLSWAERVRAPPPAPAEDMAVDAPPAVVVVVEAADPASLPVPPRPQAVKPAVKPAAKPARDMRAWLAPVPPPPAPVARGPTALSPVPCVTAAATFSPADVLELRRSMARLERLLEDMQRQLQTSQAENARLRGELALLTRAPPAQRAGEGPGPMEDVSTVSGGVGDNNGL
jgi:hypothetical protein